jgi:hypothetical protein
VPDIIRKTRNNSKAGNLQSRIERGRTYIQRLEHNFEKKFVFKPRVKREED